MLPSTGLFKAIVCPFYHAEEGISCYRPYCHFKHVRKDDPATDCTKPQENAFFKPPKLLTLNKTEVKRKKLEYTPNEPGINVKKSFSVKNTGAEKSAPVYVPSESLQTTAAEIACIDLNDCDEEIKELSEIFREEETCGEIFKEVQIQIESIDSTNLQCNEKNITLKTAPGDQNIQDQDYDSKLAKKKKYNDKDSMFDTHISSSSRSHRENGNNSFSSSRSKHKKHSRESHDEKNITPNYLKRSHSKKLKITEINKNDNNQREERRSSKSKCIEKGENIKACLSTSPNGKRTASLSSSLKHLVSPHKNICADQGQVKKPKTSSSSTKSSSPSLKSLSEEQYKSANRKHDEVDKSLLPPSNNSTVSVDTLDDLGLNHIEQLFPTSEEDIRKECEMIYDQMEQHFASMHRSESPEEPTTSKNITSINGKTKDVGTFQYRKRIAYENSINSKSLLQIAPRKPSHIKNAMKSIYHRQEEARKQQEEKTAALKLAEENVRKANEALRKVQEKELTPLIPKINLQPLKPCGRIIAPVANILALERAKKKVEELRAERNREVTLSQTASKKTGRIAHTSTNASKIIPPKPPVLEAESTKISFNIRMQYYEIMVKHCSAIYPNITDAWDRAQSEELAVFKKCNTPVIYKNSAMLTINKLRKESIEAGNKTPDNNKVISHEVILAGKLAKSTSWSVTKKIKKETSLAGENFDKLPGHKAYEIIYDLRLTEDQLVSNSYPRPGLVKGTAIISNTRSQIRRHNKNERYCRRCSKVFDVSIYDSPAIDECNFHPKGTGYKRGFADNQHRCCQQPAGTPGCSYANYHVSEEIDSDNLKGYITTIEKGHDYLPTKKDVFALDCEMCYTTHGIELTRVTVVDINARTVYDALVKPENKIIDYNTIYSGITEHMMENETRTLRDVQVILLSMFHSKTVLIGHSLESDLKALKLIHNVVVDTSVLFPHKMGPPKKRALKTLCIENLKRIIQEDEGGHDSAEDAEVCIQLVKFYLKNHVN